MKIEKNVPMPENEKLPRWGYWNKKYPFDQMAVGDSVFFAGVKSTGKELTAAKSWFRRHDRKMISRTVEGGVRIWRIA